MTCSPILIIEDERDVRETLREILELEGFKVLTASNGKEALTLLREQQKSCLILLDLMMPVMNGWQFLEVLKAQYSHLFTTTPVVVVSAAADLTAVKQQYNCRIMNKPCDVDSLITIAREHCEAS